MPKHHHFVHEIEPSYLVVKKECYESLNNVCEAVRAAAASVCNMIFGPIPTILKRGDRS